MLDFAWVFEFSIFRVFELFDLCGFLNFYLCLFFWGWGIEEGVVEKLCLNLSTTPTLNGLLKIYWGIILGFGIDR